MVAGEYRYRPAWWLPGGHAQTVWGKFARHRAPLPLEREVMSLPDGDQLELYTLATTAGAPRVLLLHGLEGTINSHYVRGIMSAARAIGWSTTLMLFRGCGAVPNTARRFYHSGETTDAAHVYAVLRARAPGVPWYAIGVSLGGNVLLKWLGERGAEIDRRVTAAVAVSVPFDLEAGARHISRGVARIYDQSFLRSLRGKALAKLARFPDLFDRGSLMRARSVFEFDDAVTAPVHGFSGALDYYARSSSLAFLERIATPTLLLSSLDDPFLPPSVLARVTSIATGNPRLKTEFHAGGGHVGFVAGAHPWRPFYYAEWRAFRFFDQMVETG